MGKNSRINRIRKAVQAGWALLANAHLSGFVTGQIYAGPLKRFCVPGLNCYSCPGALGACPVGALQASFTGKRPRFPFYVLGFLMIAGVAAGRFICGWLCLFGLIQELLYKIPIRKIDVPVKADKAMRYLKYAVLLILVILLPVVLRDEMGLSVPYFCKYLCPAGMLEGGIPLFILNRALRPAAHFLYVWKFALLLAVLVLSAVVYRPFCKYICPLGAFYGLFHKIGFLKIGVSEENCTDCGLCGRICPMQVDPRRTPDSAECIRCGLCAEVCPEKALAFRFSGKTLKKGKRS